MKYIIFTQNFVQNKIKINLKLIYVSLLTLLVMSKKDFKTKIIVSYLIFNWEMYIYTTILSSNRNKKQTGKESIVKVANHQEPKLFWVTLLPRRYPVITFLSREEKYRGCWDGDLFNKNTFIASKTSKRPICGKIKKPGFLGF